jgi:hypothetical protein
MMQTAGRRIGLMGVFRPRWWRLAAVLALLPMLAGCNAVMLAGYFIGGRPSTDPDFHVRTKEHLQGANGKNVVLVYCYAPKELKWDNEAVDYDIAKHVAHRLLQNKIRVIDPDQVYDWLDKNDKWRKTSEIGKHFKVDYVLHIDVKDYSLFEPNSANLYRGRSDIIVNVVKMNESKTDGHVVYTAPVKSYFPTRGPKDSSEMSFAEFRKHYLSELSDEIGRLFYPKETGDDIPYGMIP